MGKLGAQAAVMSYLADRLGTEAPASQRNPPEWRKLLAAVVRPVAGLT